MGIKLEEYGKGDFLIDLDIVIERSRTNEKGVTIFMWKNHKKKFRVEIYDGKNPLEMKRYVLGEAEVRRQYEKCCEDNPGCSPYPEAEDFYKRKGIIT